MKRGFFCIGLFNPKYAVNVGSVMRAAGCYGAVSVMYSGTRYKKGKQLVADPQKFHRHIPLFHVEDLHDVIPYNCVPVAVELVETAQSLVPYKHPERAFYVFGAEDGTLGKKVLNWCRDTIYIPTTACMNLAATVNVVLYDRLAKGVKT